MFEIAGGIILAALFFIGVILMFSKEGRDILAMIFTGIVVLLMIGFFLLNNL
jgi:di/tricarboxylate transporter